MQLEPIAYANAGGLVLECFADLVPPRRSTVADWAETSRWMSNPGGGLSGRWRHDTAPYLTEPMRCLTGTEFTTVALAGPGQSGKNAIAENWFLHSVAEDPGNFLWYMPTDGMMDNYVKTRLEPAIDLHDAVKARLSTEARDNTLGFKRFRGMHVEFLSATGSNLISKSAPRLVVDEIDAYPESLGDVMVRLNVRRQTFGRESKILVISHPDRALGLDPTRHWKSGVMGIYADSDRRTWWWPCPHCGVFSSPNPGTPRFMALSWTDTGSLDQAEDSAHLLCPVNGCIIEDGQRPNMLPDGRWIGLGETIDQDGRVTGQRVRSDTAGFWVVGTMSTLMTGGINSIARAMAKAAQEMRVTGEDKTLREVTVKQLGIPYQPVGKAAALDAQSLAERAEPGLPRGEVPAQARVLTVQADTQGNRFEIMWRAHGVEGESWIVQHHIMPAQPATDPGCWLDLLTLMSKPLPITGQPGRALRPRCIVFDSGGEDGVTARAMDAWKRARRLGLARMAGQVRGADAWTLLPSKGGSTPNAPRVQVTYPDTARKDRSSGARGEVPLLLFNPNSLKDDASLTLATTAGPVLHLPAWLTQAVAEPWDQLTAETRDMRGKWERKQRSQPNELWDLLVLSEAARRLHGLDRILWTNPPAWALDLTENSMVTIEATEAGGVPELAAPKPDPWAAIQRLNGAPAVQPPALPGPAASKPDPWAAIKRMNGAA